MLFPIFILFQILKSHSIFEILSGRKQYESYLPDKKFYLGQDSFFWLEPDKKICLAESNIKFL